MQTERENDGTNASNKWQRTSVRKTKIQETKKDFKKGKLDLAEMTF